MFERQMNVGRCSSKQVFLKISQYQSRFGNLFLRKTLLEKKKDAYVLNY